MKVKFSQNSLASIGLIILGILGLFLGPLALVFISTALIILGIYNIYKKSIESGIILLLIGIAMIVISQFLYEILSVASYGCILIGIIMLIYYLFKEK